MKPRRGRQTGAALLALVFVVVAASTYLLVLRLNAANRPYQREQQTVAGLNEAKQALIAYALSFPDLSGTLDTNAPGPGYMPCPDVDNDGSPDPKPFTSSCENILGRITRNKLGANDYTDNTGERFWYALSPNFGNVTFKHQPMNSETPGQLSVDEASDIVAVIIAPGPPTATQTGRPSSAINDYLDGENADGDNEFSSHAGNDRLVYITRQELMQVIEKRVLGDVATALKQYRQATGVYPWLDGFNPTATDYDATANTREGQLAYNEVNEVFPTQFSVSWDIRAGGDGDPYTLTPTSTMPDWNSFSPIAVDMDSVLYDLDASIVGPECKWIARDAIRCAGRAQDPDPVTLRIIVLGIPITSVTGTRHYDFDISIPSGGTPSICVYTACPGTLRNRDVNLAADPTDGFPSGTKGEVTITDSGTINSCLPFWWWCLPLNPIVFLDDGTVPAEACLTVSGICYPLVVVKGGSATNVITTATDGDMDVYETAFDLGVGDEIPSWLTENNWHKLILIAYSAGDAPDNAGPCIPAGIPACITLVGAATPTNNKHALVISAGIDLLGNRPSAAYEDYFELENSDDPGDDEFIKGEITSNDQVRVLQ
ncbi:MAG: hypothetical protein EPO31_14665 [Gammaproteobacteria bacterium]|nr:MAG: hypothetical protein EPO31_14665 [Gammaproteobacteria bacterium]